MRMRIVFQILLVLALLGGKTLPAQSLFGSRGPVAQFGQGFQSQAPSNSLSSIPVAGIWGGSLLGPTDSQSGRTVGSGSRFSGSRLIGPQAGADLRSSSAVQSATGTGDTLANQPDQSANTARRGLLQTRQRIAFHFQPLETETVVSRLAARFANLASQRPDFARVVPQMGEAGELLLSGDVDSEDSRKLAEILAQFEPGVHTVVNRLTVSLPAE